MAGDLHQGDSAVSQQLNSALSRSLPVQFPTLSSTEKSLILNEIQKDYGLDSREVVQRCILQEALKDPEFVVQLTRVELDNFARAARARLSRTPVRIKYDITNPVAREAVLQAGAGFNVQEDSILVKHPHAAAANLRAIARAKLYNLVGIDPRVKPHDNKQVSVKNVGGNPFNTMINSHAWEHVCCPVLSAEDVRRFHNNLRSLENFKTNDPVQNNIRVKMVKSLKAITNDFEDILSTRHCCTSISQKCGVTASALIGCHSAYDMTLRAIGESIMAAQATVYAGVVIFDPKLLTQEKGFLPIHDMHFKQFINPSTRRLSIMMYFSGDPQPAYVHDVGVLKQLYFENSFSYVDHQSGTAFNFIIDRVEQSHEQLFFRIHPSILYYHPESYVIRTVPFKDQELDLVIYCWSYDTLCSPDTAREFKTFLKNVVTFGINALFQQSRREEHMLPKRIVCPPRLFRQLYSYAMSLGDGKMTISNLNVAANSFNTREISNGTSVTTFKSGKYLEPEQLSILVTSVAFLVWIAKYEQTQTFQILTEGENLVRKKVDAGFFRRLFTPRARTFTDTLNTFDATAYKLNVADRTGEPGATGAILADCLEANRKSLESTQSVKNNFFDVLNHATTIERPHAISVFDPVSVITIVEENDAFLNMTSVRSSCVPGEETFSVDPELVRAVAFTEAKLPLTDTCSRSVESCSFTGTRVANAGNGACGYHALRDSGATSLEPEEIRARVIKSVHCTKSVANEFKDVITPTTSLVTNDFLEVFCLEFDVSICVHTGTALCEVFNPSAGKRFHLYFTSGGIGHWEGMLAITNAGQHRNRVVRLNHQHDDIDELDAKEYFSAAEEHSSRSCSVIDSYDQFHTIGPCGWSSRDSIIIKDLYCGEHRQKPYQSLVLGGGVGGIAEFITKELRIPVMVLDKNVVCTVPGVDYYVDDEGDCDLLGSLGDVDGIRWNRFRDCFLQKRYTPNFIISDLRGSARVESEKIACDNLAVQTAGVYLSLAIIAQGGSFITRISAPHSREALVLITELCHAFETVTLRRSVYQRPNDIDLFVDCVNFKPDDHCCKYTRPIDSGVAKIVSEFVSNVASDLVALWKEDPPKIPSEKIVIARARLRPNPRLGSGVDGVSNMMRIPSAPRLDQLSTDDECSMVTAPSVAAIASVAGDVLETEQQILSPGLDICADAKISKSKRASKVHFKEFVGRAANICRSFRKPKPKIVQKVHPAIVDHRLNKKPVKFYDPSRQEVRFVDTPEIKLPSSSFKVNPSLSKVLSEKIERLSVPEKDKDKISVDSVDPQHGYPQGMTLNAPDVKPLHQVGSVAFSEKHIRVTKLPSPFVALCVKSFKIQSCPALKDIKVENADKGVFVTTKPDCTIPPPLGRLYRCTDIDSLESAVTKILTDNCPIGKVVVLIDEESETETIRFLNRFNRPLQVFVNDARKEIKSVPASLNNSPFAKAAAEIIATRHRLHNTAIKNALSVYTASDSLAATLQVSIPHAVGVYDRVARRYKFDRLVDLKEYSLCFSVINEKPVFMALDSDVHEDRIVLTDYCKNPVNSVLCLNYPMSWSVPIFVPSDFGLIQAGPGTGKTTRICNEFNPDEDVVVCTTKEGSVDLLERLFKNCGDHRKCDHWNVSTIASMLVNHPKQRFAVSTLWVDEARMCHFGDIVLLSTMLKPKRIRCLGDGKQLPWFPSDGDRTAAYFDVSKFVNCKETLAVNYRNPTDAVVLLNKYFKYDPPLFSSNKLKRSVEKPVDANRHGGIASVLRGMDLENCMVLCFTRPDKAILRGILQEFLRSGRFSKYNLATTDNLALNTVHEYQGKQARHVVVVRCATSASTVYNSPEHHVVALSRHQETLTYVTVDTTDKFSEILSSSVSDAEIAAIIDKRRGGGNNLVETTVFDSVDDLTVYAPQVRIPYHSISMVPKSRAFSGVTIVTPTSGQYQVKGNRVYVPSTINGRYSAKLFFTNLERVYPVLVNKLIHVDISPFHSSAFNALQSGFNKIRHFVVARFLTDSVNSISPGQIFDVENANAILDLPNSIAVRPRMRDVVDLAKFTVIHDHHGPASVINFLQDVAPGTLFVDTSLDNFVVHDSFAQTEIPGLVYNPLKTVYSPPTFDTLSPVVMTNVPGRLCNTAVDVVGACLKRNLNVPDFTGDVAFEEAAKTAVWRVVDDLFNKIAYSKVKEQGVGVSNVEMSAWANKTGQTMLTNLENPKGLHFIAGDQYQLGIKPKAKPVIDVTTTSVRPQPQTLVYTHKEINAVFCSIVAGITKHLSRLLPKHVVIFSGFSPEDFARYLDKHVPVSSIPYDHLNYEGDIGKFDKSQLLFALLCDCEWFRVFGVPEHLIRWWYNSHAATAATDLRNGVRLHTVFQRKSGDASTFLFNTLFLITMLHDTYDLRTVSLCIASGDDSVVYASERNICTESIAIKYNLDLKMFKFKIPYVCSKFLLPTTEGWKFVPDPVKLCVKFGRTDIKNKEHLEECRVSFTDLVDGYRSYPACIQVAAALKERYKAVNDHTDFLSSLPDLARAVNFDQYFFTEPGAKLDLRPLGARLVKKF